MKSPYYNVVKIDRKIGLRISQEINQGVYKTYILTGHAGDGKTSILVQVLKSLQLLSDGEGLDEVHEYDSLFYVKDMSEIAEQEQVRLLEKALNAPQNGKTGIIVSNTGPLLNSLISLAVQQKTNNGATLSSKERIELQSRILTQLDQNEDKEIEVVGYKLTLVNIARVDNVFFARKILQKILNPQLWEKCEGCAAKTKCPIINNQRLLLAQVERVGAFVDNTHKGWRKAFKRRTTAIESDTNS